VRGMALEAGKNRRRQQDVAQVAKLDHEHAAKIAKRRRIIRSRRPVAFDAHAKKPAATGTTTLARPCRSAPAGRILVAIRSGASHEFRVLHQRIVAANQDVNQPRNPVEEAAPQQVEFEESGER
jgi:hypothetical protein